MSAKKPSGPGAVVLGDINIDIIARVERFPQPGEDCLAPELELHLGGVAANTAVALAKWGVSVRLLGSVGQDAFGELVLGLLRGQQVDVSFIQRNARALTGLMYTLVSADGQRTFFGSRGANAEWSKPGGAEWFEAAQMAHLFGYNFLSPPVEEVAEQILAEARKQGRWVSLDVCVAPSRQIPQKILQVARKVDILFVSLGEAAALTGEADHRSAFGALERCGAGEVVMKLGEKGCWFRDGEALREAPSFSVPAMDTTGAGDAFAAAFLRARLHGWPRAEAALVANAAGAAAACVVGAGEGLPTPQQVFALLRANRLDAEWDAVRTSALERLQQELSL